MASPGYWMHETSGVLRPVVEKLINGDELDMREVSVIRAYLRQWMKGDFRGPVAAELRAEVDGIFTHEALKDWLARAVDEGIDPL